MAQKPAAPTPPKAEPAKKPAVKAPAAKPVKKVSGTQGAAPGNLDALVNKHLATFRNADKTLAEAKRVFEKFYLGASRLSMRRMAARSMKASDVWTLNS
jgi:hypothetical protein